MDCVSRNKPRISVAYILTFILVTALFYFIASEARRFSRSLNRLREEMDDYSHTCREQQHLAYSQQKPKTQFACLGGGPPTSSEGSIAANCEPHVNSYVNELVQRKVGNLMDDVYNLKNLFLKSSCAAYTSKLQPNDAIATVNHRVNFASEDLGARILKVNAKPISNFNIMKWVLGMEFCSNPPIHMLRPSLTLGSCFGYRGSKGTVWLYLAKTVIVDAISLTHVAKEITPTMSDTSAPKEFDVQGVCMKSGKTVFLGNWTYENASTKRTQSFKMKNNCPFRKLIITFHSNYGANITCIYRVEVFGKLP